MANYKKLGKDVGLMTIGSFGSKILTFLFVPFYTAVLTTEEYGISDLITTTITLVFPFFSVIICEALMRFALDNENDKEKIWECGMVVWLIGSLAFIVFSPLLLLIKPLKQYYGLVVLYYIIYSFHYNLSYYVRGINKVKLYALTGTFQSLCIILLNLLFLLYFKIGLLGYILSQIIACLLASLVMFFRGGIYKIKINPFKTDKELLRRMLSYSFPMMPNSVSWWVANSSDRYILTAFSGVAATGIYSIAYKIPTILTTLSQIFVSAWRLSAVEKFGSKDSIKFYEDVYGKLTALLVCACSGLMLLNKPLASVLYQKDFYIAWQCVPCLLLASVFHAYADFMGTIYTSAYKTKFLFISTCVGAVTNIVLNYVLIPSLGGIGAAFATMVSYFVTWIIRVINSRKIIELKYKLKRDALCYVIVLTQMSIATFEVPYEFFIHLTLTLAIFVILRKEFLDILMMFKTKIFK